MRKKRKRREMRRESKREKERKMRKRQTDDNYITGQDYPVGVAN